MLAVNSNSKTENLSTGGSADEANEKIKEEVEEEPTLSAAQRARAERQRLRARQLREARLLARPQVAETVKKIGGGAIDTGGGFLLEEDEDRPRSPLRVSAAPAPLVHPAEQPHCEECERPFPQSFLFDNFDHPVCDPCKDEEKHSLVTRTEAKNEFLLQDCDLDKRPPPLRCLKRKNPHSRRGDMRLYLRCQVEARAIVVWGSEEALEAEKEKRADRALKAKSTAQRRRLKELRMNVRSTLFTKDLSGHQHTWAEETYDEDADMYSRACTSCPHVETYEKM